MSFCLDEDELQELCRNSSKDRDERLKHINTYRQGLVQDIFDDILNPSMSLEQVATKYGMKLV